MTTIFITLILAVVLFFLELVLPGGILGMVGGTLMLVGVYLAYDGYGPLAALFVFFGCIAFAVFFFALQFRVIPKTRFGRKIFLKDSMIRGSSNVSHHDESIIGSIGEVVTQMSPGGMVQVNGRRFEGRSQSGYLEKGTVVEVVGRDVFRLLVRKKDK